MLYYELMRKDRRLSILEMTEDGDVLSFQKPTGENYKYATLLYRNDNGWLRKWWNERHVPIEQGRIAQYLRRQLIVSPKEYLLRNLGLSLTDYYWIRPSAQEDISWVDVNLFDNDFKSHQFVVNDEEPSKEAELRDHRTPHYTPNSSLQGKIEKTWVVSGHDRYLVKGNRTKESIESINEVIASEIHKRQGNRNYAEYFLVSLPGKPYKYGCATKMFTSQEKELIHAYDIYNLEKRRSNVSGIDHFISMAASLGADKDSLRDELEYMIMTDFIISEYDRHMTNFGVLRDDETLKVTGLAPIYDSGGCFFVNRVCPTGLNELYNLNINGIYRKEKALIKQVKNPKVVDLDKLPPASFIADMYALDEENTRGVVKFVCNAYEKKIEMVHQLQMGRDPWLEKYLISIKENEKAPSRNDSIPSLSEQIAKHKEALRVQAKKKNTNYSTDTQGENNALGSATNYELSERTAKEGENSKKELQKNEEVQQTRRELNEILSDARQDYENEKEKHKAMQKKAPQKSEPYVEK